VIPPLSVADGPDGAERVVLLAHRREEFAARQLELLAAEAGVLEEAQIDRGLVRDRADVVVDRVPVAESEPAEFVYRR